VVKFGVEAVELEELAMVALLNYFSILENDVQPSNLTLFLRYEIVNSPSPILTNKIGASQIEIAMSM